MTSTYFDFQGVLGRNISTLFRPFRPSKWFNFGFMYSLDIYHQDSTSFGNCNAIPAHLWEDHVYNLIKYSINFYLLTSLMVGLFAVLTQFICFFLGSLKRICEKGCSVWWII